MKKLLAMLLCLAMVFSLAACSGDTKTDAPATDGGNAASELKVGVILIGDETEGYTLAHMNGIKTAAANLGMADTQIIWNYTVSEDSTCYDKAVEMVENYDCDMVISNSYGHQDFMAQAAENYPETTFIAMTGDCAAICGRDNMHNAFTKVYESRYVSGVVAGMKIAELVAAGALTDANYDEDGNIKVGYVGAFNYAEVVSGYTAFFLGIKSIVENVSMDVSYTSSWFNVDAEAAAAEQLVSDGCVIICQHADSTGAPSAVQQALQNGTVAYSVGYNIDMLSVAPDAALTSATNDWSKYYTYAFETMIAGGDLATNWAKGYSDDAVAITTLGPSCAEGTAEKVAEIQKALKDGTLHVFDTSAFTADPAAQGFCSIEVDAEGHVTSCKVDLSYYDYTNGVTCVYQGDTIEAITNGYFAESESRSAPYFSIRIDGITELN